MTRGSTAAEASSSAASTTPSPGHPATARRSGNTPAGAHRVADAPEHARDDALVPFEEGRHLASLIPGAGFVSLDSANHILLEDEPAWGEFRSEVSAFLPAHRIPEANLEMLSRREQQVLALVADGKDNQTIADALNLSVRTVERHLPHCYTKLGLTGRTARAGAAARFAALAGR